MVSRSSTHDTRTILAIGLAGTRLGCGYVGQGCLRTCQAAGGQGVPVLDLPPLLDLITN